MTTLTLRDFSPAHTRTWIDLLRGMEVKAAHPDDGWVDRQRNRVHLAYPQFNDGIGIGDLLALGSPQDGTRLVRVIGFEENRFDIDDPHHYYLCFVAAFGTEPDAAA